MQPDHVQQVIAQLTIAIDMLTENERENPSSMVAHILNTYRKVRTLLETHPLEELRPEQLRIKGSVRAYLDAATDYMNPMLGEMHKAEKMIQKLLES
jgi:hypothetical protein